MVRDLEFIQLVLFVPVGWGRWLQRVEDTGLIQVLAVSIPTAPTNISFPNNQLQICGGA